VARGAAELVPLNALLQGLAVTVTPDNRARSVTLSSQGRTVTLYDGRSLASVGGDLRLLSANVAFDGGRWLVPIDSAPRFLGPLLGRRVEWRAAQRVLLVGDVAVPRVTVGTSASGDAVRVVLEASERVPFRVVEEPGRVVITVDRDVIDVTHRPERFTGGIVEQVSFVGGRDNAFAVTLGQRFRTLQRSEQENRLVLDFQAAPVAAVPSPSASPGALPSPEPALVAGQRTVVIDPGHGGAEVGALGPGGTMEKDVTLGIARKLRGTLAAAMGMQAFLTRDGDQEVPLEDRAAFANNYKADLFVSIHANASRSHGARGSEVYFLSAESTDDEARRLAMQEGGVATGAAPQSDLALILWDMAQAEHLVESSALASQIQTELAEVTGSQTRGVKQAPFRVLVGAAMPAVLVEVAFISNEAEEKLLVSDTYQTRVAAAIARGIARYQQDRERRLGTVTSVPPRFEPGR
jgi:N-acetylmuramoyl-L-alanine amidase